MANSMHPLEDLQQRLDGLRAKIFAGAGWRQPISHTAEVESGNDGDYAAAHFETDGRSDLDDDTASGALPLYRTKRWQLCGWAIVVLFIGGGFAWAGHTRIDGASIALGTVGVESNRKSVAHLEGGIVREILVVEGQRVRKGDVLVRLDDTRARATLELLQGRMDSLKVRRARLLAERAGQQGIDFPSDVLDRAGDPKMLDLMDTEMQVLETRRKNLDRQDSILVERISKQNAEIRGYAAKRAASTKRLALLNEELDMMQGLLKDGLVARNKVLSIERGYVDTEGEIHDLTAKIAEAGDEIQKLEMERALAEERHQEEVAGLLQETQERQAEVAEKIRAATDISDRTSVLSPADGTVVALRQHTLGGVLQAGEPILDLMPDRDRFVIDLRINPDDIDTIYTGQRARVRLTAYNTRTTPMIEGEVVQISADRLVDPATGAKYFSGRVVPDANSEDVNLPALTAGMMAEVFLVTAERSVLDYLLSPLSRSLERAGREL